MKELVKPPLTKSSKLYWNMATLPPHSPVSPLGFPHPLSLGKYLMELGPFLMVLIITLYPTHRAQFWYGVDNQSLLIQASICAMLPTIIMQAVLLYWSYL